jgi:hypothetical protein
MVRGYYSLANSATQAGNPTDIMVTTMSEDGSCPLKGCIRGGKHEHTYFSWDGNGHSHETSWISADSDDVIDLSDAI